MSGRPYRGFLFVDANDRDIRKVEICVKIFAYPLHWDFFILTTNTHFLPEKCKNTVVTMAMALIIAVVTNAGA